MKANVTFPSNNLTLAGILFTPDPLGTPDDHVGGRLPAVVISHPGGGVKEQSPSIYAERLAAAGFAALVFDAAHQGESEGEPRGLENPFQRAEDIKSAVSYLTTRDDIDPDRIGALGICASGGYVPYAAQTDHRIRSVATVSATDMGSVIREGLGRTQDPAVLDAMLDRAGALRTAEAAARPRSWRRGFPTTPRSCWRRPPGSSGRRTTSTAPRAATTPAPSRGGCCAASTCSPSTTRTR